MLKASISDILSYALVIVSTKTLIINVVYYAIYQILSPIYMYIYNIKINKVHFWRGIHLLFDLLQYYGLTIYIL